MFIRLDRASNSIRRSLLVTVLAIAAAGATWLAVHAKAQSQSVEYLAYGIVGITAGQTVRLNAVTVGVQNDVPVELLFFDGQGAVIGRMTEKVTPGRAIFLDFHYSPAEGIRHRVRGVVRWVSPAAKGGYVIPTFEVIDDATGRTTNLLVDPQG